jgi:hypothetical protein
MPDLSAQIEQVAAEPLTVVTDGQTATEHNLKDLIEADKYLKGIDAADPDVGGTKSGWGKVRMARAVPPGAGPYG